MKHEKNLRKIFAVLLTLSLVFASVVSVSAGNLEGTGNNSEGAENIQILGLGGFYDVNQARIFNAIIPGKFSSLKIYNNGEEIEHGIKGPSETSNNYRIALAASDIKYVGENLIKIVATYQDGTTKSAQKMMHTYPQMSSSNVSRYSTELNCDFDSLAETFNTMDDTQKATAIKSSNNAAISIISQTGWSVANDVVANDTLGKAANKVLKFSGATAVTDLSYLQIVPKNNGYSQILNFNVYLHGKDVQLFDVMLNGKSTLRLNMTGFEKDVWHDIAIVWDMGAKTQTTYVNGVETSEQKSDISKVSHIRIRSKFSSADEFAAIDNLTLRSCDGKVPGVDKIQYHTGNYNDRTDIVNGVIPNNSNAKGLVVSLTRGIGGDAREITSNFKVYKNGKDVTSLIKCYYKKPTAVSFIYSLENSDGSIFAPGKYMTEFTGNATFLTTAMAGKIQRNFYVTNENGVLVLPGTSIYDGKTFSYNMEYALETGKNLLVVAAIYDANNGIVDVKLIDAPATGHEISGYLDGEGTKAALFVWDKETLQPIDDGVWEVAATTASAE